MSVSNVEWFCQKIELRRENLSFVNPHFLGALVPVWNRNYWKISLLISSPQSVACSYKGLDSFARQLLVDWAGFEQWFCIDSWHTQDQLQHNNTGLSISSETIFCCFRFGYSAISAELLCPSCQILTFPSRIGQITQYLSNEAHKT